MAKVKLRLNQAHRQVYGEKAIEFSLLTMGGLVITQVLSEQELSPQLILSGVAVFLIGFVISYQLLKRVKKGGGTG